MVKSFREVLFVFFLKSLNFSTCVLVRVDNLLQLLLQYSAIMSNHKKNHQHNNNHTLQQLAVGLQPLNLNVLDTPPVFTFTVTDYSSPEKPADITPTQVKDRTRSLDPGL